MTKNIEVLPDPSRMIEGLRDTGYQFDTAIADIIDNSIAAEATFIDVKIEMDYRGKIGISIADDGYGMDKKDLINAMQYGSPPRPDPASLGKFGLGLKTASTAFCRNLSVISRPSGNVSPIKATWDLDHVVNVKKWEIQLSEEIEDEIIEHLELVAEGNSGTVVVWEKVDRLLKDYQNRAGTFARRALNRYVDNLKEHIAMIYQRFLDSSDTRAGTFKIIVNGQNVAPWDPFCRNEDETEIVADQEVPVETHSGAETEFKVKAYVIPRREDFSSDEAGKSAKIGNYMQGFYIYRENRLIHHADWLGMYRKEPHGSLLRVEFSFNHTLDEAFHIDLKKSQILLNEDLYSWLKDEFLPAPRRAADTRYRTGQRKKTAVLSKGAHDPSNRNISTKQHDIEQATIDVIDNEENDVEITNKSGRFRLKIKTTSMKRPGENFVQPVDSIDDGLLWEPAIIDSDQGVQINTGHPYYFKVYRPNLSSGVMIQGMDSLLWALCVAELNAVSEATRGHFSELRFEVSRILRKLVEDLPEPEDDNSE